MIYYILLLCLLCAPCHAMTEPGTSDLEILYQRIPVAQNDPMALRLRSGATPNLLRVFTLKDQTYTALAFNGGVHLGRLYVVSIDPQTPVWTVEAGAISNIATSEDLPFLKASEIMVTNATGGTGEHHTCALFLSLGARPQILAHLPLFGQSTQGSHIPFEENQDRGSLSFTYHITKTEFIGQSVVFSGIFKSIFENVDAKLQRKVLAYHHLPSLNEPFKITLKSDRTAEITAAKGVSEKLKPFLNAQEAGVTLR